MSKTVSAVFLFLFITIQFVPAQVFNVSEELTITKVSENVFLHTCDFSNGIIYVNDGEAVIVSTPPSDKATKELIDWTIAELKAEIVGYVIDRWHPDAMEGLDVVQNEGIKSYSYELTRTIAGAKGLPVPDTGFDPRLELKVGNGNIICHYFGPAHTTDGIVVWVPGEEVLFGGNEIRSFNGWVGNIGDAVISEWSATIEKVKKEYGQAKVVIPGHGRFGGPELIDYTIELYKPNKWGDILRAHNIKRTKIFNDYGDIFETAAQDSVTGSARLLKDAVVFVDNNDRYIKIEAPLIQHNVENKTVTSEYGRMQIFNKEQGIDIPVTDVYYNRLTITLRDDEIGIVIIMREMIR